MKQQEQTLLIKENDKKRKIEQSLKEKESTKKKEEKIMKKKGIEAKKLEALEAEILGRLKETHLKQQNAIEEIESAFKTNTASK